VHRRGSQELTLQELGRKMARKAPIDQDLIRELASLLDETGLSEIEIEQEGLRGPVPRQTPRAQAAVPRPPLPPPAAAARAAAAATRGVRGPGRPARCPRPGAAPAPATLDMPADPMKHPGVVTSPMVGVAYMAPEPGAKPFVDVGSVVKTGDTVLIIEAMKTMNHIPAPRAGTVKQILIEDGRPVELPQPWMIVD